MAPGGISREPLIAGGIWGGPLSVSRRWSRLPSDRRWPCWSSSLPRVTVSPLRLHGNYLLIYKTDIDNPANAATMKLVAAKAG
jgi:hypothetical protein